MNEKIHAFVNLASTLVWRELVIRYKRSALGVVWALVDPTFQVLVYFVVFGTVLGAGEDVDGYALFTAMGVLPWMFFSVGWEQCTGSIVEHGALVRKISFPHEVLIVSVLASRLSSLAIGLVVVLAIAGGAQIAGVASPNWAATPLMALGLLLLLLLTAGLGLATSALQVVLGDVLFLVRFGLRLAFYACPVVYPLTRVPDAARTIYELNPLVAIIWCFQAFSSARVPAPGALAWASALVAAVVSIAVGLWVFRRLRGVVAELV